MSSADPLGRAFFARDAETVARDLLGCVITTGREGERVAVRLTEVEAYRGAADPASHAFRGKTPRNAVMFGPAGHLYLYFVYGMHWCANIVTGRPGAASAVLLRAGQIIEGIDVARERRPAERSERRLASGPARLAGVLGWGSGEAAGAANGGDLCADDGPGAIFGLPPSEPPPVIATGPRVGVAAAAEVALLFWISGDPTVSAYRRRVPRTENGTRKPFPG
ncbi:MAG: DNA-3-methyladenine glycosylase [Nakamurella sp.]